MSVFISWSGQDRDVKNVIAARLQKEKIEFFDSDEDCTSDFSKECIENIRRSSIFLVIISEHSMNTSSYVINEVIEARRRENEGALNILVYKITDAPYTERFAFNLNHISDANHLCRSQKLGATGAIDTLIKRIRHLEKIRAEGRAEKPYDVLIPYLQGTPVSTRSYLGYFVDGSRSEQLADISAAFEHSGTIILSEFFGYGKKSIIKMHAAEAGYIAATELDAMGASLRDFLVNGLCFTNVNSAAFDGKDEKTVLGKKFEMLSRLPEKMLLIITDVELDDEPDELVISLLGTLKCRVAIVTQSEAEEYDDYFPVLTLGRMTNEQLTELFYHYYDRGGFSNRDELTPLLHGFFDEINGHTKTVELTASVLAKEMRADISAAKNYLTAHTTDSASLTERITERLSDLIELERFPEAEKNVLLIIALTANPSISIEEIKLILSAAELDPNDVNAVIRLKDKRWITLNRACRTVSIEPMIARLCVMKLMSSFKVAEACLKRLTTVYESSHAHTTSVVFTTLGKLERLCRLTSVGEAADVLHAFMAKQKGASATDGVANERFLSFFERFMDSYDAENEKDLFTIKVAAWVLFVIIPSTEIFSKIPNSKRNTDLEEAIFQLGDDYISLSENADVLDALSFFETQGEDKRLYEILSNFSSLVLSADFEQMEKLLDEIIAMLDCSDVLEDSESCDTITGIVKLFCAVANSVGAYRAALSVLEKLISYELPPYNEYQLMLVYSNLLIECDDPPQSPSEIMAMAEQMLDEAAISGTVDEKTLALSQGDLLFSYASALASEGDFDGALEKIDALDEIGRLNVSPGVISLLSEIAKEFSFRGDKARAASIARKYEDFLRGAEDDEELHDNYKECARSLLAYLIPDDEILGSDFGRGGIIEVPGYYEKYSQDKKNSIFKMGKYRRVADCVKRYDFTAFTEEDILAHSMKLRERAQSGEQKMNLASEAFALVSEVGSRTLGYYHHYVQYVGAAAMLDGKIAEILNGEGKTYTIALVAFVNSLYSDKVFVTDSSQYLTERNCKWMRGLYSALGLNTKLITAQERRTRFLDDNWSGIIYVNSKYLAVAMMLRNDFKPSEKRDLKQFSLIIDEADTLLVESAKTPFTLVDQSTLASPEIVKNYAIAWDIVSKTYGNDAYYTKKKGRIVMSDSMRSLIEEGYGLCYSNVSDSIILPERERIIRQAIYSAGLKNGVNYVVRSGEIFFENERDGSVYNANAENSYFILKKEGLPTESCENALRQTTKTIDKIYVCAVIGAFGTFCGASATASSFKKEFRDLYDLEVIAIPPAMPIRRTDRTVTLYTSARRKNEDIVEMIREKNENRQPVLLIVRNTSESVYYSQLLTEAGIKHGVLNAANSESSPEMLAQAGRSGSVLIATQLANRGVDIKLGGDAEMMTLYELINMGVDVTKLDQMLYTIPSKEILESDTYKKYASVLDTNRRKTAADRDIVIMAGGLTVISSEPYDNMRVEQQIRGRAGRQGNVGESYIFESIDDETYKELLPHSTITRMKNMVGEDELISFAFFRKITEKAKERLHHVIFSSMKSSKTVSDRIERSKKKIISYRTDSYDESTVRELVGLWASDELIISECANILDGYALRGNGTLAQLYKSNPLFFDEFDTHDIRTALTEAAKYLIDRMNIPQDEKSELLFRGLRMALEEHLTEMEKNDCNDSWNGVKHSEKFYTEKYEKNLLRHTVAAIDRWLCLSFRTKPKPTVIHKRINRSPQSQNSTLGVGRNDPCPCGSGRKYKSCCGADKQT